MELLLISNSTNAGEEYLHYPMPYINEFLNNRKLNIIFIPYAGITISYDAYTEKVNSRFLEIGQNIKSIHTFSNPVQAIEQADCIVIGGGNTWQLLNLIQKNKLIEPIRKKVLSGCPYIGWSAGSNLASPTIRTTNDMAVVQPDSFNSFGFVPFQINPHYLDANPAGHAGETREDRINEFITVNQNVYVVGLREGSILHLRNNTIQLLGKRNARIFRYACETKELAPENDFSFLLS